ncbi:universal stress protein [Aquimarina rhabdastrellae]
MKHILVPTDFSKQADSALKVAVQMAKKHNSKIFLLHILELPVHLTDLMSSGTTAPAPEAIFLMKHTHNKFEKLMQQDFLQNIDLEEIVSFSDIRSGITENIKKHDIDIIIMGSHGSEGLEEIFIGSNAEKIVRTSDKPVLVIKEDRDIFSISDFVYATNFDDEDKTNIKAAHAFAQEIDAKLHLLWINTPNNFKTTATTEEKMNLFMADVGIENYSLNIYNDLTVEKGILNFSKNINAGLIGISTHGRKGISHFINGSLSEDLVNHAKRPVITFKI